MGMRSSRTSSNSAKPDPLSPQEEALLEEAGASRLKHETFERALGRVIRRSHKGKEAYALYIRLISERRKRMEKRSN
ncbi:MAG: hypothetical protein AB1665_06715 [Candidatus Thermoplasmatota archaeon]